MKSPKDLAPVSPLACLGFPLEKDHKGGMLIHQRAFVQQLLAKHGLGQARSNGISAVTVPVPDEAKGRPPTPAELRGLQATAGELNWLATRARADLAYFASALASGSTRFAEWRAGQCVELQTISADGKTRHGQRNMPSQYAGKGVDGAFHGRLATH